MSEDWRALGAEGGRCMREARWADAIAAFERLLAINPDHANSWFNLGYAQRHARHFVESLESYQRALDLKADNPEAIHLNRAVILSEHLHRPTEAEKELKQAIALNPGFAQAWLNLGNLREDLGQRELAIEAYEGAIAAVPSNGRALARIGTLMTADGNHAAAIAFLQKAATEVRPGGVDAAEVMFALGNAYDSAGDYPPAFAAASQGNAIASNLREPGLRYNRQEHERRVSDLIAAFPRPKAPARTNTLPVIFICGMFRSGSTLIEQMLARHSKVTPGGELEFIPAMVAEQLQPYPRAAADLDPERVGKLRSAYLGQVESLFPGAGLVTDKRPDNFLHIGLIKTLFPEARIVHTVRNPLDNILSAFFLYFGDSVTYSDQLEDLAHYYGQYRRLMDHWAALYGEDIFAVDYDRLVADPTSVMKPLLDFVGLDWEESVLDQKAGGAAVRTASVWQVRKPLHQKSSGRWRNYRSEMSPIRDQLLAQGLIGPKET
ncbi:MAG TPA: sulfotransferase [Sphingomicrobium sp.]|nr:sulfotransferase [Sphingomicrobium sp.]